MKIRIDNPGYFRRYKRSLEFLKKTVSPPAKILDLGVENPFTEIMKNEGYEVINTRGEDLDENFTHLNNSNVDVITAFEIFEHMLSPYQLLKNLDTKYLVATVPLKVWFAKSYWSKNDPRDRHFHEFEPRQFDWLLEKTGWKILYCEKWKTPPGKINGIRPVLRFFVPSYYAVFCEKIQ